MTISPRRYAPGVLLVALMWAAVGCSGGDSEDPASVEDGKLAPESASMKWEQSLPASTEPAHVIRRYSAPLAPGRVRSFYIEELERRGWKEEPSADLSFVQWSRDGMQILLVFEPPSSAGSEWSLALFAAE